MSANRLRWLMNVWPPYLAAGIRVREIASDWSRVRVELRARWWNRNYVGVHFGGSLFAMTDPFYMLMYMKRLGPEFTVWDYGAEIRFQRPGRGTVRAEFRLEEIDVDRVQTQTAGGDRYLHVHEVEIRDQDDLPVARIERTLYFRRRMAGAQAAGADSASDS